MRTPRRARDVALLDALENLTHNAFDGEAWRIVREGRNPLQGHRWGGRWDPPDGFDVLYMALDSVGAKSEIFFHLNRAPVFSSNTIFLLHKIRVRTRKTLRIADLQELEKPGVDVGRYAEVSYREVPNRTQEIGDAAHFLGYDGLIVPSARFDGDNLVLFTDRINVNEDLELIESAPVDWEAYRRARL